MRHSKLRSLQKNLRRLQDVLKTSSALQFFVFQEVLKTSCKMSPRRVQDVFEDIKLLR